MKLADFLNSPESTEGDNIDNRFVRIDGDMATLDGMFDIEALILILLRLRTGKSYNAGFDCGLNGPNETNCHFEHFATPEMTAAWERGKSDADEYRPMSDDHGIKVGQIYSDTFAFARGEVTKGRDDTAVAEALLQAAWDITSAYDFPVVLGTLPQAAWGSSPPVVR